ncbi:MAG TPA: indole-3-glycerol phosphate synthase TrpC [Desulfotomaculum sp.]|nr:indole-3-glycerol phosphate synthase TrpC [Desulfotomaculum sp.]
MFLDEIVAYKKFEIAWQKEKVPLRHLERNLANLPSTRPFKTALRQKGVISLIAEIKKASPSRGPFDLKISPAEIAQIYTQAGAAAISIVTETKYFSGQTEFLALVRPQTGLPLLRKDFIIDPYQIIEARFYGADAILLIVAILSNQELAAAVSLAAELGLACLVEVHTKEELKRALAGGARIIGFNNRNLQTFQTDLTTTCRLREYITDPDVVIVSESGISSYQDILALQACRVNAVLVGEALMQSPDPAAKIKELLGG